MAGRPRTIDRTRLQARVNPDAPLLGDPLDALADLLIANHQRRLAFPAVLQGATARVLTIFHSSGHGRAAVQRA